MTLLAVGAFISLALVLTQSRGALLAVIAGTVAVAFVRSRKAGLVLLAGFLAIGILAYPAFSDWRFGEAQDRASLGLNADADASGRIGSLVASQQLIASSPVFGIGYGRFSEESSTGIAAHNWYTNVLAEMGIVGGALWALFIVALVMALRRRSRSAPDGRILCPRGVDGRQPVPRAPDGLPEHGSRASDIGGGVRRGLVEQISG